jgi:hypothetical protein
MMILTLADGERAKMTTTLNLNALNLNYSPPESRKKGGAIWYRGEW